MQEVHSQKRGKYRSVHILKESSRREQDGGGVGECGVHLSPWIHQEYTFRYRSACRTPAESHQEYLTSGKNIQNHAKLCRTKELGEKTRVLEVLDLPSAGGGT